MLAWDVGARPRDDAFCAALLQRILKQRRVTAESMESLCACAHGIRMRKRLRALLEAGCAIARGRPRDDKVLSFLSEFLAGISYAARDDRVGKLGNLRARCMRATTCAPIEFLHDFCSRALQEKAWRDQSAWFRIRAACMDAYCLSVILGEVDRDVIFYGGMAHTTCVCECLVSRGLAVRIDASTHPLFRACRETGILHAAHLRLAHSGRTLFAVGENHAVTRRSFADSLIRHLRARCDEQATLFLIEKHISNGKDPVQRSLMCNQPDLAIQASRCSAFLEREHSKCSMLKVMPVDNRHADLGFLRTEIMELWAHAGFRERAQAFVRSALRSICRTCEELKAQRSAGRAPLHAALRASALEE